MEFLEKLLNLGDEVKNAAPLWDRIMLGLQTTLIGMSVVFIALIILWAVLSVFRYVFYRPENQSKDDKISDVPVSEAEATEPSETTLNEPDDGELVAVITAAIACMLDKPETAFKVVSFRRTASK